MALRQTRDGYLWLTTADGVTRFDGVNFRVFNKVNTPGLTTNWFSYRALWEDAPGNLWMAPTMVAWSDTTTALHIARGEGWIAQ